MALAGPMDITFNYVKDLPIELKQNILSFISIRKFVSYNDTKVDPLIHEYIKDYINTRLFTDAKTFTFLRHTQWYGELIDEKMFAMAAIWAKDFVAQCKLLNDKPDDEKPDWNVFFNVKYNCINTPKLTSLRSHHNGIIAMRDTSVRGTSMNEDYIISEIVDSISHFMNNYKGIYQIRSIELVETYYDTSSSGYHFTDVFDSSRGLTKVIKKYY